MAYGHGGNEDAQLPVGMVRTCPTCGSDVDVKTKGRTNFYIPHTSRCKQALEWALDLLDMYDERLIELGEPPERVYSDVHLAGKAKAREALHPREGET